MLAGGQGIEPRFFGPKPNVLPLDDPPLFNYSLGESANGRT